MWAVFQKAFRDYRRTLLWLSLGLAGYALMTVSFYPLILAESENLTQLMDSMPSEMLAMFMGSADVETLDITDPGTYLQARFGTWLVLILGAIAISQAFNAITNEERSGAMDVMMSLPVSRREMLMGRMLHTVVMLFLVLTACFAAFSLSRLLVPEFDVAILDLAMAVYGAFLPLLVIAGFAYLLAALIPARHKFAGSLAYLFMIGSYLFYSFTLIVSDLESLQPAFLFHYFNMGDLIRVGISVPNSLLLLAVTLVYLAGALWGFDRKELAA